LPRAPASSAWEQGMFRLRPALPHHSPACTVFTLCRSGRIRRGLPSSLRGAVRKYHYVLCASSRPACHIRVDSVCVDRSGFRHRRAAPIFAIRTGNVPEHRVFYFQRTRRAYPDILPVHTLARMARYASLYRIGATPGCCAAGLG
jgi:hypothetical protein